MPRCVNCNKEILNSDRDICPYCGYKDPLPKDYKTMDVTSFIDPLKGEYKLYKSKRHITASILALILGLFGAEFFYLEHHKWGLLSLVWTALVFGGVGSLLYFLTPLGLVLGYIVIPLILGYLPHLVFGIYLLTPSYSNFKDGKGEFLH